MIKEIGILVASLIRQPINLQGVWMGRIALCACRISGQSVSATGGCFALPV